MWRWHGMKNPDPGDEELLARATRENRVLVTMDKDFGQHVFVKGAPHCGIVRLPDVPRNRIIYEIIVDAYGPGLPLMPGWMASC